MTSTPKSSPVEFVRRWSGDALVFAAIVGALYFSTPAHASVFESLALAIATNRANEYSTPPWKILASVPDVKWKASPHKALSKLQGVMTVTSLEAAVPKTLSLSIEGAPVGFHRVEILGSIKHGVKDAGSISAEFSPKLFGNASLRRIFTTCDDDGAVSMTAHYSVEYDGQRPIYLGFDAGIGNAASTIIWRIHLTEASMLSSSGPTCERI